MVGGKPCFIGPLRKSDLEEAVNDCFLFMANTKNLEKVTAFLDNAFETQAREFLNQNNK